MRAGEQSLNSSPNEGGYFRSASPRASCCLQPPPPRSFPVRRDSVRRRGRAAGRTGFETSRAPSSRRGGMPPGLAPLSAARRRLAGPVNFLNCSISLIIRPSPAGRGMARQQRSRAHRPGPPQRAAHTSLGARKNGGESEIRRYLLGNVISISFMSFSFAIFIRHPLQYGDRRRTPIMTGPPAAPPRSHRTLARRAL